MTFPKGTRFRYTWRPYQKRILDELDEYLDDDRLHVVAAPGSGKTVLGLEVVIRINRPTLVLAPTIAIRDQWVERLKELFLPDFNDENDWISYDIREPRFFTVSTYQGLHSAYSGELDSEEIDEEDGGDNDEEASLEDKRFENLKMLQSRPEDTPEGLADLTDLARGLKRAGIDTVVVDEAHHLRSSWWRSLTSVIDELGDTRVLALTATPPYDVSQFEWERYYELCGDIDAEVAVPELVLEDNLCPHQDYIMFSTPSEAEKSEIDAFRKRYSELIEKLANNPEFKDYLLSHTWIISPELHMDEILDEPAIFSSILVFLNHCGIEIPRGALEVMTDSPRKIPNIDEEWTEILLQGIVFPKDEETPEVLESVERDIRTTGLVYRRRVRVQKKKRIEKILKRSISKLQSIIDIIRLEYESQDEELRTVVLTDYIRRAFMPKDEDEKIPLTKLGAVPIFEAIRREKIKGLKFGVLSGSLVIIPKQSEHILWESLHECDLDRSGVSLKELKYDNDFYEVEFHGSTSHKKVEVTTEFFRRGGVNVLVGTKALLGEGWDAPCINTLILASFVGSYMMSNQMRGRAIRTERGNPTKTANVWHLVCLEPDRTDPGPDYATIKRRFKAFLGPTFGAPVIQSGLDRLIPRLPPFSKSTIEEMNQNMAMRAKDRDSMRDAWDRALKRGEDGVKLVEEIQTPKERLPRGFVFENTISALFWQTVFAMGYYFSEVFRGLEGISFDSWDGFLLTFGIIFLIAAILFLPKFFKALLLFIRHGPIKSSIRQVGEVVLKTLCQIGEMRTPYQELRVVSEEGEYGVVFCHIEGGTSREQSLYLESMREVLDAVRNPRYILVRKSKWRGMGRRDYHAIPKVIGTNRENSEYFASVWKKMVSPCQLVYTRNQEGRLVLLQARAHSLSAAFVPKSQRISRWK